MKITDTESIKTGENEFIDNLLGELDWSVIERLLKEKYRLKLHDDIEYKDGDIVVHRNKVAYKLNFDVRVTLSLVFGRDGECLDISTSGEPEESFEGAAGNDDFDHDGEPETIQHDPSDIEMISTRINDRNSDVMASRIASMMNEIND